MAKKPTKRRERRRPGRFGHCAICDQRRRLTEDHVPPRSCFNTGPVTIRSVVDELSNDSIRPRFSQRGLTFESICDECNEHRLGREYDPALRDFTYAARPYAKSVLTLPRMAILPCVPQRVARAVIGHLLAAVPDAQIGRPVLASPAYDAMREYFLNPGLALPNRLAIGCWPFPTEEVVVVRGLILGGGTMHLAMGSILKFYPLAFWVFYGELAGHPSIVNLLPTRTFSMDHESLIALDFGARPHPRFPEGPGDHGSPMFSGERALIARPRGAKRPFR